ncbi:hypothetical protein O0L34_g10359 [Tuta absoluta]|nr:hypothetical protein O0L34_g10359 [Tuta absoluta]
MESLAGEEMERALMDLGPLLGVSIKEEAPDEAYDAAAATSAANGTASEGAVASGAGTQNTVEGAEKTGADSLASPGGRPCLSQTRCVLCNTTLAIADGTPKLMECLHSACEPCVKAKIEEKLANANNRDFLGAERVTITCPVCRLPCQTANMIDQRFVMEKQVIEQSSSNNGGSNGGEQQCSSCEETEPATSYCVDCAEFICESCVHAHQRLKITKDHTIKTKEEALADLHAATQNQRQSHDMFCREHPQERLSLFCETCDRLTCRDCQLQHHRDHKYQFSTEMAQQARTTITGLLSEVSYKRVLLDSAMKVIRDRQHLIADKKKALVHEITQTVVKLTNAINTRGKQLVLRLNEVCDTKLRTLNEKRDALTQLAAVTDHCVQFVQAALDGGSDTALLYSKTPVTAHLHRIKSRRADIPNPEIPVRISLALDPLPDLLRVLSTIGAIVVDGKVDGGAGPSGSGGGAQGPYHPPAAPPAPASQPPPAAQPPPTNQHQSAVVALQHAAMHQSYVQSMSSSTSANQAAASFLQSVQGGGNMRARHTPLRHPHVTSTTHPHHLHGMSEMNLRGLLTPARASRPHQAIHPAQQAMQQAYQQMMGAYANNAAYAASQANMAGVGGRRSNDPRTPSPAPQHTLPALPAPQSHQQVIISGLQGQSGLLGGQSGLNMGAPPLYQHAKWHIPQHQANNGGSEPMSGSSMSGDNFKITLSRQNAPRQPSLVTSTNPKTPSPSLHGTVPMELDKVCAESVQDLMATIAKLDSNGVQVVAESAEPSPSPAPSVHSSTDAHSNGNKVCAVCATPDGDCPKLDSNGVQVVAESAEPSPSPAPSVHSSTDAHSNGNKVCAVCATPDGDCPKLDSNGVQVVAESAEPSPSPAPSVHSSTDAHSNGNKVCAVCATPDGDCPKLDSNGVQVVAESAEPSPSPAPSVHSSTDAHSNGNKVCAVCATPDGDCPKLDSNGVQVVAESAEPSPSPAPSVHSSTDAHSNGNKVCAVCATPDGDCPKLDSNGVQVVAESAEPSPSPAPSVHSSTDAHSNGNKVCAVCATPDGDCPKLDSNGVQVVAESAEPSPSPAPSVHSSTDAHSNGNKVCAVCATPDGDCPKLDSNGVQVVAESAEPSPSPAPSVHSSTDAHSNVKPLSVGATASGPSDPNEDWCAVCMDGGELMCCDKCPKVFHQYCHIPTIEKLPDETETWQCLLCVNFAELPPEASPPPGGGLSPRMRKIIERVTLELYCQYEPSLAFREPVPTDNIHYHSKIQHPMCLDMIRMKLQPGSPQLYTHPAQFVSDCRLMFRNAYHYNPADSQIYKDAKRLEEFFDAQLLKWLPDLAYWSGEGEPPAKRARND